MKRATRKNRKAVGKSENFISENKNYITKRNPLSDTTNYALSTNKMTSIAAEIKNESKLQKRQITEENLSRAKENFDPLLINSAENNNIRKSKRISLREGNGKYVKNKHLKCSCCTEFELPKTTIQIKKPRVSKKGLLKQNTLVNKQHGLKNISEQNVSKSIEKENGKKPKRSTNSNKVQVKRLASKAAALKLQKVLRVSLEQSTYIENLQKSKIKTPEDIYEFVYDSDDELQQIKDTKGYKKYLEDSGDENNSMKIIMKKLRQADMKKAKRKSTYRRKKNILLINKNSSRQQLSPKVYTHFNKQEETKQKKPDVTKVPMLPSIEDFVFNEISEADNYSDNDNAPENNISNGKTKTISEEIIDSFSEDHLTVGKQIRNKNLPSSRHINVISNDLICEGNTDHTYNFDNRKTRSMYFASPWRVNVKNNSSKHTFNVKDKSFIPSYDQDIVINSTFCETIISKQNDDENKDSLKKNNVQTNLMNFINSSKNYPEEINSTKPGTLFDDIVISPRKVLGELNVYQSTPYHNVKHRRNSPNVSEIKSNESRVSNLFGFSCTSDDDNINSMVCNKENVVLTRKLSPKKEKLKTVLFTENTEPNLKTKYVVFNENVETVDASHSFESVSSADIDLLFQDIEDENKLKQKKFRRSYERKKLKRRRLPSIDSEESDHEDKLEKVTVKYPNKKTKQEEEEINRLATFYNSMFNEIDQHELCIV